MRSRIIGLTDPSGKRQTKELEVKASDFARDDSAHVAGRFLPEQGCSSLSFLPFIPPASDAPVAAKVVAMALGAGRKSEEMGAYLGEVSLRQARLSSPSAPATPASSWAIAAGHFPAGLVAFGDRDGKYWMNSSEQERAGVLQKAKQTEAFGCLVSSYIIRQHSSGAVWMWNGCEVINQTRHSMLTDLFRAAGMWKQLGESQTEWQLRVFVTVLWSAIFAGSFFYWIVNYSAERECGQLLAVMRTAFGLNLLRVTGGRRPHFLTSWGWVTCAGCFRVSLDMGRHILQFWVYGPLFKSSHLILLWLF